MKKVICIDLVVDSKGSDKTLKEIRDRICRALADTNGIEMPAIGHRDSISFWEMKEVR